jgi:phenylalanyl-tRNA synthetase beta chain
LFESASFDASHVRRSSIRHGVRTESSARFEKTLDPNQITDAIMRFSALCEQCKIKTKITGDIVCVGEPAAEKTIGVTHSFLERRSGVKFEKNDVIEPLTRLGFTVVDSPEALGEKDDTLYTIKIPSFRATKDIGIKEDILEEVVRFFGFDNIALQLPLRAKTPCDMTSLFRCRKIAEFLVYAVRMSEQKNYLYYDEEFLKGVGLEVILELDNCISLKNPVSENNYRIVSSLLPNLFKNIKENCVAENSLRFFEFGRVCCKLKKDIEEKKMLTGIIFEKRKEVDFYECKSYIDSILKICDIDDGVVWKKLEEREKSCPWATLYQSVELFLNDVKIGVAGKADKMFLSKLDGLPESDAFFFDLDIDKLLAHRKGSVVYTPISKFPGITFDLCFMIPVSATVASLESILLDSDDLIERVQLIDFFDKEEWVDSRSVAFRIWASDPEKTLLKEEIESIRQNACKAAEKEGAQLR